MADQFGAVQFPVPAPASKSDSVSDPALDKLGGYLQAVLNANLNTAWHSVTPGGRDFIENVIVQDPQDGLFNESQLPALFLWRVSFTSERISDDWTETTTDVNALWVPQTADQARRALRSQIINGLEKNITHWLRRGRHPAWIDPGDTSANVTTDGSVLIARARFLRWPKLMSLKPNKLTIEKDEGVKPARYPGALAVIRIFEKNSWDPALRGSTAALTSTVIQGDGAFVVAENLPPTP